MLNTFKLGLLTASTVAVLATAPLSFAQTTTPTGTPSKCTTIGNRINTLVTNAQTRHDKIVDQHQKVAAWWNNIGRDKFIDRYGLSAYTQLTTDFSTLQTTYGAPLETATQTYVSDLQTLQTMSQNGECGTSNGAFAAQVKTVKADRTTVQTDLSNWRGYFNGTIRAYVKSLRGTTPTPTPSH